MWVLTQIPSLRLERQATVTAAAAGWLGGLGSRGAADGARAAAGSQLECKHSRVPERGPAGRCPPASKSLHREGLEAGPEPEAESQPVGGASSQAETSTPRRVAEDQKTGLSRDARSGVRRHADQRHQVWGQKTRLTREMPGPGSEDMADQRRQVPARGVAGPVPSPLW